MIFKILITLCLLLTAGTSAYMAIFGLVAVFRSYPYVVGCLGLGLELGKILIVIYVHRHWKILRLAHKFYYIVVILALVLLTSAEVTGFLSQAHSITGKGQRVSAARLASLEIEKENLQDELRVLEETLKGLPETYVTKRLSARREAGYYKIRKRLAEIEGEIGAARETRIISALEAGPIFAVGELFGLGSGAVVVWFILALVCVAEPMSIGVAVAVSSVWLKQSPVVTTEKPLEPKVGKMSKSHVERIERKSAKSSGKATPDEVERAIKEHRVN